MRKAFQHRRFRSALSAPFQPDDEPQIQNDVQHGGNGQKYQRHDGISHRPQERSKEIVQENPGDSHKNHEQIGAHIPPHLVRDVEKYTKRVQTEVSNDVQKHRRGGDGIEGRADILAKAVLVPLAEADGKQRTASHAQSKQDGGKEGHQGKGRPHRRKCIATKKLPDDQGVGNIIALLEQVAQNHGDCEQQHGFGDGAFCQISIHYAPPGCRISCVFWKKLFDRVLTGHRTTPELPAEAVC